MRILCIHLDPARLKMFSLLQFGIQSPDSQPWVLGHVQTSSTWKSLALNPSDMFKLTKYGILESEQLAVFYPWVMYIFRPQRSWGKVMFLHVSVILLTGEGLGISACNGADPIPGTKSRSPQDQRQTG